MVDLIKGPFLTATRLAVSVLGAFSKPLPGLVAGVAAVTLAMQILGFTAVKTWFATFAPLIIGAVLIAAIGAAVLLLIDDFEAMGEGGESVVGGLISEFQRLHDETDSIFGAIDGIIQTSVDFWAQQFKREFGIDSLNRFFESIGLEAGLRFAPGQSRPGEALLAGEQRITDLGTLGRNNPFSVQANTNIVVNAPAGANAGDIAQSVGTAAQKGTERGLRQAKSQLELSAGG